MSIYEELGVRRLINARCILGRYGDSLPSPPVLAAMADAAGSYVHMGELHRAVSRRLAELTRNEAAMVCGGAADGGKIAIAAAVAGNDPQRIRALPHTGGVRDRVIMHNRGRWGEHVCVFSTGCRIVEIGGDTDDEIADALASAMTADAAAVFVMAMGRKPKIPIPLAVEIARPRGVKVIVDSAYEAPPRENLWHYTRELGADAAIFSGGKGLRGPASTGLIVGRFDFIDACRACGSHCYQPGVAAKLGKEEIAGLYAAVKDLVERDQAELETVYDTRMSYVERELGSIPGVRLRREIHGKWADDFCVHIAIDPAVIPLAEGELYRACAEGDPPIEIRSSGVDVTLCVSTLRDGDERIVVERLKQGIRAKMRYNRHGAS